MSSDGGPISDSCEAAVHVTAIAVERSRCPALQTNLKCAAPCSYLRADNVVYLTIADKSYPRKLAFSYLDELTKEFSTSYSPKVAPISLYIFPHVYPCSWAENHFRALYGSGSARADEG